MTHSFVVLLGLGLLSLSLLQSIFAQNPAEEAYKLCSEGAGNSNILVRGICDPYELLGVDAQIAIEEKLIQLKRLLPCACGETASCNNVERGNARHDVLVVVTKDFPNVEADVNKAGNSLFQTAKLGTAQCSNGLLLVNAYDQGQLYAFQGETLQSKINDATIRTQIDSVEEFIANDNTQPRGQKLDSFVPGFLDWYITAAYPDQSSAGLPVIIPSRNQPSLGAYQYCRYEDINARLCDPNEALVPDARQRVQKTLDTMIDNSLACPCASCAQKGLNYDPYIVVTETLNETAISKTSEAIYRDAQLGSPECDNGVLVMLASDRKQLYMKQGAANKAIVPTDRVLGKISELLNTPDGASGAGAVAPEFMEWYEQELLRGSAPTPVLVTAAPSVGPVIIPVPLRTPEPVIFVTERPVVPVNPKTDPVPSVPIVVVKPEPSTLPPAVVVTEKVRTNMPDYSLDAWKICRSGARMDLDNQLCDPEGLLGVEERRTLGTSLRNLQVNNECRCKKNGKNETNCGNDPRNYRALVVATRMLNQNKSEKSWKKIYKGASLGDDDCDNGLLLLQGVDSGEFWYKKGSDTKLANYTIREQVSKQVNSAKLLVSEGRPATNTSKEFIQWYSGARDAAVVAKKEEGNSNNERDTIIGAVFGALGGLLLLLLLLCCCCGWCPCWAGCCGKKKSESYIVTDQRRVVPYGVAVASNGAPNGPKSAGSNYYVTSGSSTLRSNKPLIANNGGGGTLRATGPGIMGPPRLQRPVSSLGFAPSIRAPPLIRPRVAMSNVSASPRPPPRGPGIMSGMRMPNFGIRRTTSVPYVHHTSSETDLRPQKYIETAVRPPALPIASKEVQAMGIDVQEMSFEAPRGRPQGPLAIEPPQQELEIHTYTIEKPEIREITYEERAPLAIMPGSRPAQYGTSYPQQSQQQSSRGDPRSTTNQYAVSNKRSKSNMDEGSFHGSENVRGRQISSAGYNDQRGDRRSTSRTSNDRMPVSRQALYDEPYEVSTETYEVPFEEGLRRDDPRLARY